MKEAEKKEEDAARIMVDWSQLSHPPSLTEVRLAAQLSWEGHLPSVKRMKLRNMDLSDINRDHIFKLTSIVTDYVEIGNITPPPLLDIILESVRCSVLELLNMTLTEPQTQALLTLLTERLERVELFDDLNLDIQTLCKYNGRGRCRKLWVRGDTRRRYGEILLRWGAEVGWAVRDATVYLIIQRK